MIGDWYAFRGHPYKCTASDIASIAECEEKGAPTDISEIPLTPEILEKNGFEHPFANIYALNVEGRSIPFVIEYLFGCEGLWDIRLTKISYVHELQHALRLCGIDKEIVL